MIGVRVDFRIKVICSVLLIEDVSFSNHLIAHLQFPCNLKKSYFGFFLLVIVLNAISLEFLYQSVHSIHVSVVTVSWLTLLHHLGWRWVYVTHKLCIRCPSSIDWICIFLTIKIILFWEIAKHLRMLPIDSITLLPHWRLIFWLWWSYTLSEHRQVF